MTRRVMVIALGASLALGACVRVQVSRTGEVAAEAAAPTPPDALLGEYDDDYGSRHTVSAAEWVHHPRSRYRIMRWDGAGRFAIAQNAESNPSDGGRWTRIDWIPLSGMAPYEWAFCLSAYNAPTADSALATRIARPDTPRTGCNGFPYTRLRRRAATPPAPPPPAPPARDAAPT